MIYSLISKTLGRELLLNLVLILEKQGAMELIRKGILDDVFREIRFTTETKLIGEFLKNLNKEPLLVAYGNDIQKAIDYGVVDEFLISEKTFIEKTRNFLKTLKGWILLEG